MYHAENSPERDAIVHWCADGQSIRWRWRKLVGEAQRAGQYLRSQGVRAGDVCAIIVRHHPRFYPLYMGVVAAGALPAVLPYPNSLTSQILPGALRFPDKLTPSPAYRLAVGTPMYDRIAFRAVFRVIHPAVPHTR